MVKMYLLFCSDEEFDEFIKTEMNKYINIDKETSVYCYARGNGYFKNKETYLEDKLNSSINGLDYIIFTNDEVMLDYMSLTLFNGRYSNPDLFIQNLKYKKIKFFDVKKYSEDIRGREIRSAHNIRKLILGGAFDIYKKGNK